MASGGPEIEQLIQLLARLPGLGPRSARRAVLQLIKKKDQLMIPLSAALDRAVAAVRTCEVCGNVDTMSPCAICSDPRRGESGMLIVVEDVADLWALERAGVGAVRYHVLGGAISPIGGIGPSQLHIAELGKRIEDEGITELILATNPTVEGDVTAMYIAREMKPRGVRVTRLAMGLPVGGDLDYADELTLGRALAGRSEL